METLNLSPDVLMWAADQIGQPYASLVAGLAKREKDREKWMEGRLTIAQIEKFAKLTGVPYGMLFLPTPPQLSRPSIPDLRQTIDAEPLGNDFQEVYEDALAKQQWYIDHLRQQTDVDLQALPFVGGFDVGAGHQKVADDIKIRLGISAEMRNKAASPENYFSVVAEAAEKIGVLVMKTGIVKSRTRRPLSVKEFRGFAISNKFAPLVFVNGRDADVAAVFTLIHELAHIWIGESGVSDVGDPSKVQQDKTVEVFCNRVAADVLVPSQEFLVFWRRLGDITAIAKKFRVSRLVVARRALDLGLIDKNEYLNAVAQSRLNLPKENSSGNPYLTIPVRNSKKLTAAVVRSAMTGDTLLRDAAGMLNVRPDTVMELGRRGKVFG